MFGIFAVIIMNVFGYLRRTAYQEIFPPWNFLHNIGLNLVPRSYSEVAWRRHEMKRLSALLFEGNPPVAGGFSSKRVSYAGFYVVFGVKLNKLLNKQSRHCWFEKPWRPDDATVMWYSTGVILALKLIFLVVFWCRGLTTCLIYVNPLYENLDLKNSWSVSLI